MKKRIVLSLFSSLKGYNTSDMPSHFALELTQKMANHIKKMKSLLEENNIDELITEDVANEAIWSVIHSTDHYSSLKAVFLEMKQSQHSVDKPRMVITKNGFYFKSDFERKDFPGFRTENIKFEELEDSQSIIL